jgi:hypothetical protein
MIYVPGQGYLPVFGPQNLSVWRYSADVSFITCNDGDTTYMAAGPPDGTSVIEITEEELAAADFFGGLSRFWPKAQLRTPDGVILSSGRAPLRDWDTEMAAIEAAEAYMGAYSARLKAEQEDNSAGFAWRANPTTTLPRLRVAEAALKAAKATEQAAAARLKSLQTA